MRPPVGLALLVVVACSSSGSTAPQPAAPGVPFETGSPWPKFRGDAAQTGASAVHATTEGGALWSFATGAGIFSSPIVAADGTVYFGSADRNFYALNPDGTRRFTVPTGQIIDSAGLLDDEGRVYFGSGDGILRAVDAKTGAAVWQFAADPPTKTSAFINWFEGNVAIGPKGTLYVPNDNFLVYALDRARGTVEWSYRMPDQTWSLAAVALPGGTLFEGNNNLLPVLGKNTYSIAPDGTANWADAALGTVAASPLLTPDGLVVVGGFDGYARAYAQSDGSARWSLATRDHIYASPARLPSGLLVQPSADGGVYAVHPDTGVVAWVYDTGTPVRSSPAVDADGHVYVGGGDGNLYVVNDDGSLRYSMKLIDDVRDDLNASPALGQTAVYIGGESGAMFSVPYDYCLRPMSKADLRCSRTAPARPDGAALSWVDSFGDTLAATPATVPGDARITLLLSVRQGGQQQLVVLDPSTVTATVDPPSDVSVVVSGDGKFLTVTPTVAFAPGPLAVHVTGSYLTNLSRAGLRLSGGTLGGTVSADVTTTVAPAPGGALATTDAYELSRLSIPLPTVMPSYNQIGFDQLHYLLGVVEQSGATGLAWMVGGVVPEGATASIVDPTTQAIFPLSFATSSGLVTMSAASGLEVNIMNFSLPFQSFRLAFGVAPGGAAVGTSDIEGSAVCMGIPLYGAFLEQLGLCNPQTDLIEVLGASNVAERTDLAPPPAAGTVTFAQTSGAIVATLSSSSILPAQHLAGILVADAATGLPVTLPYGTGTTHTTAADGTLAAVSVPTTGVTLPAKMNVYLMVDTTVGGKGTL